MGFSTIKQTIILENIWREPFPFASVRVAKSKMSCFFDSVVESDRGPVIIL